MTNTVAKHWRLVLLGAGTILLLWVLYLLRIFVLPFVVGLVLAYLLMPFVNWLESALPPRDRWESFKRAFSIAITFLLLVILIGVFAYFIVTAVIDASVTLLESAPNILSRSLYQLQAWLEAVREQLPPQIQAQIGQSAIDFGNIVGGYIRDALLGAVSSIPNTVTAVLGFATLPFFLFYILKDSEKLKRGIVSALSPAYARHARNLGLIVEQVLGRYIRAQVMLGLIVAYFSFIGLLVLKVPFAPALAILAGLTEMIPTLGPWIGGAVAVVVTLATAPEMALWVAVLYLGIQLVENSILVPRIQSGYLHIHPAAMIVLLVFGAYIAGFWGLLVIGPLTATLVEIVKYVRGLYPPERAAEAGYQAPGQTESWSR